MTSMGTVAMTPGEGDLPLALATCPNWSAKRQAASVFLTPLGIARALPPS